MEVMGKRRGSRELAVQVLFHMAINGGEVDEVLELVLEHFGASRRLGGFARELISGVVEHSTQIERLITGASDHWRLERMPLVDRSILKVAVFEIGWRDDIPPRVSIDEAVEIGKIYGGDDSSSFINGVLDRILAMLTTEGGLTGEVVDGMED
ncbi:MAG TPA: transcription antitermination factor NusB [Desulfobacteraceae bacterium]|nr:transcription antitermination factor NusB [Desulfobacteraceae bacterium]